MKIRKKTRAESFLRNAVTPAVIWQIFLHVEAKAINTSIFLHMFVRTGNTFLKQVT